MILVLSDANTRENSRSKVSFMPTFVFLRRRCFEALALILIAATAYAATDTRLVDAVKSQNMARARALVRAGAEINATEPDGTTALHWAAQWNDLDTVELLLKGGAKVNVSNDYGATPLWLAALNGSTPVVERLLAAGADPNMGLAGGETPLMTAARTGSVGAMQALLRRGAKLEANEGFRGQTALMWALSENHLDAAKALIEAGANVSAQSFSGFTPLMFAAREGNIDAARLLIAKGANINAAAAGDGSTPLIVATVRGHSKFAMFLLDQGADPNLAAPGYTALHWAAGKFESVFTWDYPNVTGEWARLIGIQEGRIELIRALLAHHADINARTTKAPPRFGYSLFAGAQLGGRLLGVTPFFLAADVGDIEVMKLLVAAGADPKIPAEDGTTSLMVAAGLTRLESESRQPEPNFLEAAKLCIAWGLDVNASNENGITPMHSAAIAGFDSIVQYLFEHGAALTAKTRTGQTPLAYALKFEIAMTTFDHPTTVALLQKLGATE
jgi:ankyrin repeat protein